MRVLTDYHGHGTGRETCMVSINPANTRSTPEISASHKTRLDAAALKLLTDNLPAQADSAAELVRALRDQARY